MNKEINAHIVRAHAAIEVTGLDDAAMNARLDKALAAFMDELVLAGVIEVTKVNLDKVTFDLTALIRQPNEKLNSRHVMITAKEKPNA
jgi:hypothetical protein